MHTLFVYGTLITDEVMKRVTGRTFQGRKAVLPGFARYRIKEASYPGIVPHADSIVQGKLYFNIDHDSLTRLDDFENDLYVRVKVQVRADDGRTYEAFTYQVKDTETGSLSDEQWDIEEFKSEHINLFIKEYCRFIE